MSDKKEQIEKRVRERLAERQKQQAGPNLEESDEQRHAREAALKALKERKAKELEERRAAARKRQEELARLKSASAQSGKLESEIEALKAEIDMLRRAEEEREKEREQLEEKLHDLEQKLIEETGRFQDRIQALTSELSATQQQLTDAQRAQREAEAAASAAKSDADARVHALQKELEEARKEVAAARTQQHRAESEARETQARLKAVQAERDAKDAALAEMRSRQSAATETAESLRREAEERERALRREMEETQRAAQEREDRLREEVRKLEEEIRTVREQLRAEREEHERREASATAAAAEAASESDRKALERVQAQWDAAQKRWAEERTRLQNAEKEAKEKWATEKKALEAELAAEKEKLKELQAKVAEARRGEGASARQLADAQREIELLKKELSASRVEVQESKAELERLRKALAEAESGRAAEAARAGTLEKERDQLRHEMEKLERVVEKRVQGEVALAVKESEKRLAELEAERDKLRRELSVAQWKAEHSKVAMLEHKAQQAQNEVARLQRECAVLIEERDRAEAERDALRSLLEELAAGPVEGPRADSGPSVPTPAAPSAPGPPQSAPVSVSVADKGLQRIRSALLRRQAEIRAQALALLGGSASLPSAPQKGVGEGTAAAKAQRRVAALKRERDVLENDLALAREQCEKLSAELAQMKDTESQLRRALDEREAAAQAAAEREAAALRKVDRAVKLYKENIQKMEEAAAAELRALEERWAGTLRAQEAIWKSEVERLREAAAAAERERRRLEGLLQTPSTTRGATQTQPPAPIREQQSTPQTLTPPSPPSPTMSTTGQSNHQVCRVCGADVKRPWDVVEATQVAALGWVRGAPCLRLLLFARPTQYQRFLYDRDRHTGTQTGNIQKLHHTGPLFGPLALSAGEHPVTDPRTCPLAGFGFEVAVDPKVLRVDPRTAADIKAARRIPGGTAERFGLGRGPVAEALWRVAESSRLTPSDSQLQATPPAGTRVHGARGGVRSTQKPLRLGAAGSVTKALSSRSSSPDAEALGLDKALVRAAGPRNREVSWAFETEGGVHVRVTVSIEIP